MLGVIESGRVVRGFGNVATELWHIPYKKAPFLCGCGRDNCLELFVSGSGVAKWAKHKKISSCTTLQDLKDSGEKEIIENFYEALLSAVGTTLTLFNPQVLVLGGGIIEANLDLEEFILKNIKEYTLLNALQNVTICKSKIQDAPLRGAFLLKDYDD